MYNIFPAALPSVQPTVLLQALAAQQTGISILSMLQKGGMVMVPLALLSLLAVYLFVERYLYVRAASRLDGRLLEGIEASLSSYNAAGALDLCRMSPSPLARVLEKGLSRVGSPIRDMESAMETMARVEVSHMERNLGVLGAIATIAPMLGFLGTVTGMIRTFYNISLYENISMDVIAGGIYEKMITSATGLVVGITAYVLYTLLHTMIERCVSQMELASLTLLDILSKTSSYELQEK
jgi:biopolymer transport protein ExbB